MAIDKILIPIKLANALFVVIVALMGNDITRWFYNEMGWNSTPKKDVQKTKVKSCMSVFRASIAEKLRGIADKLEP